MERWVVVALLAGCGRIAFDPTLDAAGDDDAAHDAAHDAAPSDGPPGFDITTPTCPLVGFTFLGTATCMPGALELTSDIANQVGAIWLTDPITIGPATSFSVQLTLDFDTTGTNPGDGFAIVVQHDPRGLAAIGGTGGQLGYENMTPSSAVELDTFRGPNDLSDNEVGIDGDGNTVTELAVADAPFRMSSGTPFTVWVDYSGASHVIAVSVAQSTTKPGAPLVMHADDLSRLGAAWFGVTAATAGSTESHRVLAWKLEVMP